MAGTKKGSSASTSSYVNPHESLSGLSRFFIDGLKQQAVDQGLKKVIPDTVREITGNYESSRSAKSGELSPGEVLNLSKLKDRPDVQERREAIPKLAGIDYRREVVQGIQMRRSREQQEMEQKLQEIMNELKRLVKSSTLISNEYASITVEQGPVTAGSYHMNFFDFMLSVIKTARMKVEDSGAWMAVAKKKNGFHKKAQTLGTKFTLSQERATATQTG